MAIRVIGVSTIELRNSRKAILRLALSRLNGVREIPEEGMEELISPNAGGQGLMLLLSAWRDWVNAHKGGVDGMAGSLFTPTERETLRETENKLFLAAKREGVARMGDFVAVKMVERLLHQLAFKYRNTANPHLRGTEQGGDDKIAAARVRESLTHDLPKLTTPKATSTASTVKWFEELLGLL